MDQVHRDLIVDNFAYLVEEIEVHRLVMYLHGKGVLSARNVIELHSIPAQHLNSYFLCLIQRKGRIAYKFFIKSLKKVNRTDIVNKLALQENVAKANLATSSDESECEKTHNSKAG